MSRTRKSNLKTPDPVPWQLGNKWVAWTPDGLHILGSGDTPEQARQAAETRGPRPEIQWKPGMRIAYGWVPPSDGGFIGANPV